MRIAAVLVALAAALALQTTVARYLGARGVVIDLALLVVVIAALAWGPVVGLLTGSVAGLLQDTMSGSLIGLGGLVKTVVGFVVGVTGTQFIVTQTLSRLVVFMGASALQSVCFLGLLRLIDGRAVGSPYSTILMQAVGNALVGVMALKTIEGVPGMWERWRGRRSGRW